jgi:two-component system, NtrC family, response regulator AtoC
MTAHPVPDDRTRSAFPRLVSPSTPLSVLVFCGGEVRSHSVARGAAIVIGRGPDAGIRIDHSTVSRRHATLHLGEEMVIVDHGSFNGTSIGGKKIPPNAPVPIALATIIEIGQAMVILQLESTAPKVGSPELSPAMDHLYRMVDNVARSNISVVVRGETGVGKEIIAEEIHRRSARASGRLVKLNCAALPEQLLEGELFGYERGAFTGAAQAKPGLVEAAHGGTLFLDEVGELSPTTQAKLLRVVETREVLRLGSLHPRSVDVRLVAATHRDLEEMVAEGAFRQDLYYRLNGVSIAIPPLRERSSEISALATTFVERFCRESKRPVLPISEAAIAALVAHTWPGNVRELRNVVERAVVFCKGIVIGPEHLALRPPPPPSGVRLSEVVSDFERDRVLAALARCAGNQTQAAATLGISRRTLLRRLDEYAVPRPRKI